VTSPPQRLSVPRRVTTPPRELSQAQRATLHRVADQLVPAAGGNPAATQAPDFDAWLDRCIAARRDGIDLLLCTLDELAGAEGADLDQALRQMHADDVAGRFHLISSIVAGAYLAGDHIRRLIGYPGQFRQPARVDEAANELADGILDPVLERGHIYTSAAGE
jgi:hypothetical protein